MARKRPSNSACLVPRNQGHRRFPRNPIFTQCRLWLLATRAEDADIDEAWRVMDAHLAMVPPSDTASTRIQDQLLVAWVIARAHMTDSALAVVHRSEAPPSVDPARELTGFSALVYLELNMPDSALDRLRVYLTASPEHRQGWRWTSHWWWRSLQDNPEYRKLIGR